MIKTTPPPHATPIASANRHGYQRTTINARATLYPLNTRIDKSTHDHLQRIKQYYDRITGLNVRYSVIMRRAIEILARHLEKADDRTEQIAIVKAGGE